MVSTFQSKTHAAEKAIQKSPRAEDRIDSLTSLRFFACFFMVFYHAHAHFFGSKAELNHDSFAPIVAFFFALSGFVIAHNYSTISDTKSALRFYLFRYSRMLPVHILTMCMFLFLLPGLFNPRSSGIMPFLCNLSLSHAWVPWSEFFFSYNSPSWSNSTEIFFYLCFPLLLFAMRKKWWLPLLMGATPAIATVLACNSLNLPHMSANSPCVLGLTFVHPISRLFEFTIGMTVALLFRERLRPANLSMPVATALELTGIAWVLTAAIFSSPIRQFLMPSVGDAGSLWFQSSGLPVLGCGLLIGALATEKGIIARILNWRLLIVLGEASFAMYMLHSFMLTYASVHFPQALSTQAYVLFWALLVVAGHFLTTVVDPPLRKAMIKLGVKLIGNDAKSDEKTKKEKPSKKSSLLQRTAPFAYASLVLLLVWLNLPALNRITPDSAAQTVQTAPVKSVTFAPYLECAGASAKRVEDGVNVKMVWKSLQNEQIKFFVKVAALDENGAEIGCRTYTASPRQETVKANTYWTDELTVCLTPDAKPHSITVLLMRKHSVVPAQTNNALMTIPL